MATPPGGARNKAAKLRKQLASGEITAVDRLWLEDYNEKTNGAGDWGKSASRKRIHKTETVEEDTAAEGTGTAAAQAASMALMAKEEGRRLDALTTGAIGALHEAVEVYKAVSLTLLERTRVLEETHVEMLQAFRGEFLARTDAEAELREKEKDADGDGTTAMLLQVVANHLGIDVSGKPTAAAKNGAAAKKA